MQKTQQKSVEKQLNRIIVLLRNGPTPEEENKILSVLGSLTSFSYLKNFRISLKIREKTCEICKGSFLESNFNSFSFRCGHKICSPDCLAQYLSKERVCEFMSCARKSCEIKTPKAEFLQGENESNYKDYTVLCLMCNTTFPVENSVKLPCSHRICTICILSYIKSPDFIDFKYGCPDCFTPIPQIILNKIRNPQFEENIRATYRLN